MPWSATTIRSHNKSLHGEKADHAARIANAVLKSSGREGTALAVASKWAKQHQRASGGPAPQVPTYQTAAPAVNEQGFVQVSQPGWYNVDLTTGAMPQGSRNALQALAERGLPIVRPAPPGQAAAQPSGIAGMTWTPQQQKALENQLSQAINGFNVNVGEGDGGGGMAINGFNGFNVSEGGGGMNRGGRRADGGATPWWSKSQARAETSHPAGLVPGMGGGRQDNVAMNLAAHSHVIPAMVVAGLGQGNPEQGAANLEHMLKGGPFGTALPKVPTRAPKALSPMHMPKMAQGGGAKDGVRTLVSPKEYIVSPADVHRIGGGDYEKGHNWLDRCIVEWRRQIIAFERKQPGPVKE